MTYSFPCTDLSIAGKMAGMERGSGTRSGLLWEVERLLKSGTLPKYLLMENVKQLVVAGTLDIAGMNEHESRVYDPEGISSTIHAMKGGNKPKVAIGAMRGRNPNNPKSRESGEELVQMLEMNDDGVANTLTTVQKDNVVVRDFRVRRLTPRECWRLMGFTDEQFDKARHVNSDTQLYKQAGNSIVVPVLEGIFRNLLIGAESGSSVQMSLF